MLRREPWRIKALMEYNLEMQDAIVEDSQPATFHVPCEKKLSKCLVQKKINKAWSFRFPVFLKFSTRWFSRKVSALCWFLGGVHARFKLFFTGAWMCSNETLDEKDLSLPVTSLNHCQKLHMLQETIKKGNSSSNHNSFSGAKSVPGKVLVKVPSKTDSPPVSLDICKALLLL